MEDFWERLRDVLILSAKTFLLLFIFDAGFFYFRLRLQVPWIHGLVTKVFGWFGVYE